jgi:SurA N-terminal domain
MKTFASLAAVVFLGLAAAASADGSSGTVAKVGTHPITKKQLDAVLAYDRTWYRKQGWTFPQRHAAEYLLLREQAIDFLVEQSRAHQADARIGIKPQSRIVSHAAWRKVTAKVHAADPLVLKKRRATIMHGFVAAAHRDYPVTYPRGYKPVAEWKLAQRAWAVHVVSKVCDLSPGMYPLTEAMAHSCVPSESGPAAFPAEKICPLVAQPGGVNGFTSAEEDDGFADYATSNAGSCAGGPRGTTVEITAEDNTTRVRVSYLHRDGTETLTDKPFGISLRYPRRLHELRLTYAGGLGGGSDGIEISNFKLAAASLGRTLPRGGIDVAILANVARFPIPPKARDSNFPLRLPDDHALRGKSTRIPFQAAGDGYTIVIREGAKPSAEDRAAVREIVTSIRFQPSRPGTFLASGFYVLGRATRYALGSVTRIRGGINLPSPPNPGQVERSRPFYLVHGKSGFLEFAWSSRSICNVRFDAVHSLFRCEDGSAWNLRGKVVRKPNIASYSDDQPYVSPAPISFDGYVLVNVSATG